MSRREKRAPGLRVQTRGNRLYIRGHFLGVEVRQITGLPASRKEDAELIRLKIEQEIVGKATGIAQS